MSYHKALYIGAGLDMRPIQHLKHIHQFIYVDSRPYSPYGREITTNENDQNTCYDYTFLEKLDDTMKTHKMKLCVVKDHKRVYSDGVKTVSYYVNTSIPEDIQLISYDLRDVTTLIVAGHDPHIEIVKHLRDPVHFVGFENTHFDFDDTSDDDELMHWLHRNKYHNYFIDFTYVYFERYFSMNRNTFSTWDEFVTNYQYYNMCNM